LAETLQDFLEVTNKTVTDIRANRISEQHIIEYVMKWHCSARGAKSNVYPQARWNADQACFFIHHEDESEPTPFRPLHSIEDAFTVVHKLEARGKGWMLIEKIAGGYSAYNSLDEKGDEWYAEASTIPLAIGRAALVAVGAVKP
jgi:hypothetical protein